MFFLIDIEVTFSEKGTRELNSHFYEHPNQIK